MMAHTMTLILYITGTSLMTTILTHRLFMKPLKPRMGKTTLSMESIQKMTTIYTTISTTMSTMMSIMMYTSMPIMMCIMTLHITLMQRRKQSLPKRPLQHRKRMMLTHTSKLFGTRKRMIHAGKKLTDVVLEFTKAPVQPVK